MAGILLFGALVQLRLNFFINFVLKRVNDLKEKGQESKKNQTPKLKKKKI